MTYYDFDDRAAYQFLMSLYDSGRLRFAELEKWLRQHAIPTKVPKSASAPESVY